MQRNHRWCRLALMALSAALCAGGVQAQSSSGGHAGNPGPPPSQMQEPLTGTSKDVQDTHPTASECERLEREQRGGVLNEDMKAKLLKCRETRDRPVPPPR